MRTPLSIALLLTVIVAIGCSQSGDFGAFIVTEVAKYGGHTKTTAEIPKLDARWTVKRDDNGFEASITDAPFATIAADMELVFGKPRISENGSGTATHEPHRVWNAGDVGVAIQLIGHKNSTEIICVRGVKDMDELFKLKE